MDDSQSYLTRIGDCIAISYSVFIKKGSGVVTRRDKRRNEHCNLYKVEKKTILILMNERRKKKRQSRVGEDLKKVFKS